jgi:predicted ester cyclase
LLGAVASKTGEATTQVDDLREGTMTRADRTRIGRTIMVFGALALVGLAVAYAARTGRPWHDEDLPWPESINVDVGVTARQASRATQAARLYYALWNTSKSEYAYAAVGPAFSDDSLPQGCRQGPEGLKAASRAFRAAVPDLRCTVEHLLVTGDKVVARLTFRGTLAGTGKPIEFRALDILRVADGRVVEVGHVEDNYNSTLVRKLGTVSPAGQYQEKPGGSEVHSGPVWPLEFRVAEAMGPELLPLDAGGARDRWIGPDARWRSVEPAA